MAAQRYKIFFEGGTVISGQLDAQGRARHDNVPQVAQYVEYEPREPQAERPWEALSQMVQAAQQKLR
jgi:type VI secretion system secreted protein VgrG